MQFNYKMILTILLLAYGAVTLVMYLYQRQMTYLPGNETFTPKEWDLDELQPLQVQTQGEPALTSWYRAPAMSGKPAIVFFQGNGAHLGYRNIKVKPWLKAGYGVLMIGYPGYNGNPGFPSEQGIYDTARAAIKKIIETGTDESHLVFYGESIGTGSATQMATEFPKAAGLILESPFTSLPDAGAYHYPYLPVRLLMRDRFDSCSKIKQIKMPLLLIHGEQDRIVPFKLGHELYEAANEPKQAVFVPQAGHNDLYDWGVQGAVMAFLAKLETQALEEK